ncbi:MAG: pentapeptide repeat-containing protein [Ginsengibacter sp.]
MEDVSVVDKTYNENDFAKTSFQQGEYENCVFNNCDFSAHDFSFSQFVECVFNNCNLSLVKLSRTAFRETKFIGCKMLGLVFESNKLGLSFSFHNCTLNHSSFFHTKIAKAIFENSQLLEVDFAGCNATGVVFNQCDLSGTKFENTNLEKADFRTAFNYSFDPELNRVKHAKFSHDGLAGLLGKYNIEIE